MDSIDLESLSGYTLDEKGLRDLQRPYLLPSLLTMATALLGFVLLIAEMQSTHYQQKLEGGFLDWIWQNYEGLFQQPGSSLESILPIIIFFGGLVAFGLTMAAMGLATPKSGLSGQKMEKYWNANPESGNREIIYVDRPSKTYFRRVYGSSSGPRIITN